MRYPLPARLLSRRIRADFRAAQERRDAQSRPPVDLERRQLDALARVWDDAVSDVPYYAALVSEGRAPKGQVSMKARRRLTRLGCRSLRSAFASIWRMRSRVTSKS